MKAPRTEYCQWGEFDEASTSSRSHKSSVAYTVSSHMSWSTTIFILKIDSCGGDNIYRAHRLQDNVAACCYC
jgi:hypothetical protein